MYILNEVLERSKILPSFLFELQTVWCSSRVVTTHAIILCFLVICCDFHAYCYISCKSTRKSSSCPVCYNRVNGPNPRQEGHLRKISSMYKRHEIYPLSLSCSIPLSFNLPRCGQLLKDSCCGMREHIFLQLICSTVDGGLVEGGRWQRGAAGYCKYNRI